MTTLESKRLHPERIAEIKAKAMSASKDKYSRYEILDEAPWPSVCGTDAVCTPPVSADPLEVRSEIRDKITI